MRIEDDVKLDFCDVLIKPKRSTLSSRKQVTLTRQFNFKYSTYDWNGVPIIAANMDTIGTIEMGHALSKCHMITCLDKRIRSIETTKEHKHNMALSFGLTKDDSELLFNFNSSFSEFAQDFKFFCLDVANGYTQKFVDFVKEVRYKWPHKIIIAGNVVSAEMTEALILAGADCVKVGIGGGSCCLTRKLTGVGYPQLSAIMECADAAHGLGAHIIADGGVQSPGDIVKALGAGADFVMLGGMFSGHDECEGKIHTDSNGVSYKEFYGMSSKRAMEKHNGGMADYKAAEGKLVKIPHKGPVSNTISDILGGIRSACTYIGARNIKDLPKCATFIRVNRQLNEIYGKS
jgi:GMP reductase